MMLPGTLAARADAHAWPRGQPLQKDNEVILFGGEWCDDLKVHVYADAFVLNVDKLSWKHVISPNGSGAVVANGRAGR